MKKFLKITGLYLLFGAVFAVIASVTGMFEGFMAVSGLGLTSYLLMIPVIMVLWMPSLAIVLFSDVVYFPFAYAKVIVAAIILLFVLLGVRIIRKK